MCSSIVQWPASCAVFLDRTRGAIATLQAEGRNRDLRRHRFCTVFGQLLHRFWVTRSQGSVARPITTAQGALQDLSGGLEAAVAASRVVAGTLKRPGSSSCNVWKRCKACSAAGRPLQACCRCLEMFWQNQYKLRTKIKPGKIENASKSGCRNECTVA